MASGFIANQPEMTFAVNYQQNFDLIQAVFESCYPQDENFSLQSVMSLLESQPDLRALMGAPGS